MSQPNFLKMTLARGRALQQAISSITPASPGGSLYCPSLDSSLPKTPDDCLCQRPVQNILCRACGNVFEGRIRRMCKIHPHEIHLMDHSCCPKCRTVYLQEFGTCRRLSMDESPVPQQSEEESISPSLLVKNTSNFSSFHDSNDDLNLMKKRNA